jgi:hypothetical protein
MLSDLLPALATVIAWTVGYLLHKWAVAHAWTDAQKQAIPVVAVVVGAMVQSGGAVWAGGGTWRDVLAGAGAGALAVAAREITKATATLSGAPDSDATSSDPPG